MQYVYYTLFKKAKSWEEGNTAVAQAVMCRRDCLGLATLGLV